MLELAVLYEAGPRTTEPRMRARIIGLAESLMNIAKAMRKPTAAPSTTCPVPVVTVTTSMTTTLRTATRRARLSPSPMARRN